MSHILSQFSYTTLCTSKLKASQIGCIKRYLNTTGFQKKYFGKSDAASHIKPVLSGTSGFNKQQVRLMQKDVKRAVVPVTWKSLGVGTIVASVLLGTLYYMRSRKAKAIEQHKQKSIGKSKIVSGFELVDCDGNPKKASDFVGQWLLVYFGFTNCPDICPEELEKISEVTRIFDADQKLPSIQPLFITVDPERDSGADIKKYLAEFHPKMIGLTGTYDQIAAACKAYRVYWSAGPKDQDNDYIVDHTIIVYLVNPDGEFVDYFGQTKNADDMATNIRLRMISHNFQNKK